MENILKSGVLTRRPTFEVGYTATRVQLLDTESNCCLFRKYKTTKLFRNAS